MASALLIGDLAKAAGMTAKTIRYYEQLGLIATPERRESGYRTYATADVERVRFIKNAKALGLSLSEIKEIVDVWDSGQRPCSRVRGMLDDKLTAVERRITELTSFRDSLKAYKDEVESALPSDGTPCVHIAGVDRGLWHGTAPEAELTASTRSHH